MDSCSSRFPKKDLYFHLRDSEEDAKRSNIDSAKFAHEVIENKSFDDEAKK